MFFQNLFAEVDTILVLFFSTHIAGVMTYISPVIYSASIILIVGVGIGMALGKIQSPAVPMMSALLTITLVTLIATNLGVYNTYVADIFLALPDDMIQLLTPYATTSGVGTTLDSFAGEVALAINTIWSSSSGMWSSFLAAMIAVIYWLFFIVMALGVAIAVIISKVVLVILITVGPVFIFCLLLPQTRDFFSKWMSYVLQFTIMAVLIGAILSMISGIILTALQDVVTIAGSITLGDLVGPSVITGGTCYLFMQLPNMSSSLTGGIGMGVGNFIGASAGAATSALSAPVSHGYQRFIGERITARRQDRINRLRTKYNS